MIQSLHNGTCPLVAITRTIIMLLLSHPRQATATHLGSKEIYREPIFKLVSGIWLN